MLEFVVLNARSELECSHYRRSNLMTRNKHKARVAAQQTLRRVGGMKSRVYFAATLAILVLCVSSQDAVTATESVTDLGETTLSNTEAPFDPTDEAATSSTEATRNDANEAPTNSTQAKPKPAAGSSTNISELTRNHADNGPHFTPGCDCGQKLVVERIVGGQETKVNEYPWQVALLDSSTGRLICGGSLINDRYILTAAHCVVPSVVALNQLRIRLREHSLSSTEDTQLIIRRAASITVHRNYNDETNLHDIALVKLAKPVRVSRRLGPVCLPSQTTNSYGGRTAVVTGWGLTEFDGEVSDVLREVEVPVLSHRQCKFSTEYEPSMIFQRMLCAGAAGVDSCQGDSGGPLVFKDRNGNYDQIGVVSWGIGCAFDGFPGVYTRVNKYLRWIERNTRDAVYCQGARFP